MARPAPSPAGPSAVSSVAEAEAAAGSRRFTRAEATATLVYLGPVVEDVRRSFGRVTRFRRLLDRAAVEDRCSRRSRLVAAHQREMAALAALVDEVQAVGAQLRDFEAGAVAFPSDERGVPAGGYLSWIAGEEGIGFAHGPDEPTEARRPLRRKARRRVAA